MPHTSECLVLVRGGGCDVSCLLVVVVVVVVVVVCPGLQYVGGSD